MRRRNLSLKWPAPCRENSEVPGMEFLKPFSMALIREKGHQMKYAHPHCESKNVHDK